MPPGNIHEPTSTNVIASGRFAQAAPLTGAAEIRCREFRQMSLSTRQWRSRLPPDPAERIDHGGRPEGARFGAPLRNRDHTRVDQLQAREETPAAQDPDDVILPA